jgi:hypothetical protein
METQGYVIFTQGTSSNVCKWLSDVATKSNDVDILCVPCSALNKIPELFVKYYEKDGNYYEPLGFVGFSQDNQTTFIESTTRTHGFMEDEYRSLDNEFLDISFSGASQRSHAVVLKDDKPGADQLGYSNAFSFFVVVASVQELVTYLRSTLEFDIPEDVEIPENKVQVSRSPLDFGLPSAVPSSENEVASVHRVGSSVSQSQVKESLQVDASAGDSAVFEDGRDVEQVSRASGFSKFLGKSSESDSDFDSGSDSGSDNDSDQDFYDIPENTEAQVSLSSVSADDGVSVVQQVSDFVGVPFSSALQLSEFVLQVMQEKDFSQEQMKKLQLQVTRSKTEQKSALQSQALAYEQRIETLETEVEVLRDTRERLQMRVDNLGSPSLVDSLRGLCASSLSLSPVSLDIPVESALGNANFFTVSGSRAKGFYSTLSSMCLSAVSRSEGDLLLLDFGYPSTAMYTFASSFVKGSSRWLLSEDYRSVSDFTVKHPKSDSIQIFSLAQEQVPPVFLCSVDWVKIFDGLKSEPYKWVTSYFGDVDNVFGVSMISSLPEGSSIYLVCEGDFLPLSNLVNTLKVIKDSSPAILSSIVLHIYSYRNLKVNNIILDTLYKFLNKNKQVVIHE